MIGGDDGARSLCSAPLQMEVMRPGGSHGFEVGVRLRHRVPVVFTGWISEPNQRTIISQRLKLEPVAGRKYISTEQYGSVKGNHARGG